MYTLKNNTNMYICIYIYIDTHVHTYTWVISMICVFVPKGWNRALTMVKNGENDWALFAKSVLDRTRLALASKGELYHKLLQPSAEYLGALLGLDQWAV